MNALPNRKALSLAVDETDFDFDEYYYDEFDPMDYVTMLRPDDETLDTDYVPEWGVRV